ncbi:MAG: DUF5666 domain-containing protein [Halioglobus sp.]
MATQSGKYECFAGEVCMIEVTDLLFDETFIGVPDAGYSFRWRQFPRGLCGGSQNDCHLFTSGFEGNDGLLALLASDQVFFLEPKFWTTDQPEVGGVGSGTITGFGSVIINATTTLSLDDNTIIKIDDNGVDESQLKRGMVVQFQAGDDANAALGKGLAVSIAADNLVKGPITLLDPVKVLGQTVVITGTTVLDNLPGGQFSNLKVNDIVEVAGHRGVNAEILATRLEFKTNGIPEWKITGPVSGSVIGSHFFISDQKILVNGLTAQDCAGGIPKGDRVEVKANQDSLYTPGSVLSTATSIECQSPGISTPDNPISFKLPAEVEGVISTITSPQSFVIDGQVVQLLASTEFRGGNQDDLVVGVRLEVEGTLNTESSELLAREIKFKESRVRIEAPWQAPLAAAAGDSFRLLGITVFETPVTDDEDGVFDSSEDAQVEVRGYVDTAGNVIAEEVRNRGESDASDTRLRGPVANIQSPTFEILGVVVDTSTAREIRDENDVLIGSAAFFGLISPGSIVSVQDGVYDGVSRLDQGKIEVED